MEKQPVSSPIEPLYDQIRSLLLESRKQVYRTVNFVMVETYWRIGQMIIEHEQGGKARADYGKQILAFLSEKLTAEFGEGLQPDQSKIYALGLSSLSNSSRTA
jgi:DUF1016 N-terminal domain